MSEQIQFAWNGAQYRGTNSTGSESESYHGDDSSLCYDCQRWGPDCTCAWRRYSAMTDPTSELPPVRDHATTSLAEGNTSAIDHGSVTMGNLAAVMHWNLHNRTPNAVQLYENAEARPSPYESDDESATGQEAGRGLAFHPGVVSPWISAATDYTHTVNNLHREAEQVERSGGRSGGPKPHQAAASREGTSVHVPGSNGIDVNVGSRPGVITSGLFPLAGGLLQAGLSGPLPVAAGPLNPQTAGSVVQAPLPKCCLSRQHNAVKLRKHQRCHRKDIRCPLHPGKEFYKQADYLRHLLTREHENQTFPCKAPTRSGKACRVVITGRPDNLKRHLMNKKGHALTEEQAKVYVQPEKVLYEVRKVGLREQLAAQWDMAPFLYQDDASSQFTSTASSPYLSVASLD